MSNYANPANALHQPDPNPAHPAFGGAINAWPTPQAVAPVAAAPVAHAHPANPQWTPQPQPQAPQAPQHGQPQYGQPQYGQPQYGQPQYGAPQQYGQPQYGAPQQWTPPVAPRAPRAIADWVRIVAYTLSSLKGFGLGLVFLLFLPFLASDLATANASFLGWETTHKPSVLLVLLGMVAVGGSLLFFQLRGAAKDRPVMLLVPAGIMALGDVALTIAAGLDNLGGGAFLGVIALAQVAIFVGGFLALKK